MELKVSILTVAFNSEKTIAKTIESVLRQTYSNIEYIIIDGLSTDNTVTIAKSYMEQFQNVGKSLIVISEKDQGMYDALNKGALLAQGQLIGQINSDDWYEDNAVEEMVKLFKKTAYDIAWADIRIIKPSGISIKKAKVNKLWLTAGFCHPSMFSRREVLLKYPYACREIDDDFDMVTRAYKDGVKIETLNRVISNYVFGGMSTEKSIEKMKKRIQMKYSTYRRNGFPAIYYFYCVAMETAKYLMG